MGSYAFTATPGKSGEALRSLLLKQEFGVPMPPTLMALLVERLTDGTAVLLLLVINVPLLLRWPSGSADQPWAGCIDWSWLGLVKIHSEGRHKTQEHRQTSEAGPCQWRLISLRQLLKPWLLLQATAIGAVAWSLEGVKPLAVATGNGCG